MATTSLGRAIKNRLGLTDLHFPPEDLGTNAIVDVLRCDSAMGSLIRAVRGRQEAGEKRAKGVKGSTVQTVERGHSSRAHLAETEFLRKRGAIKL